MSVQTSYGITQNIAFRGQKSDLQLSNTISKTIQDQEVDFGLALVRGTLDATATLATATGSQFVGISQRTLAGTSTGAGVDARKYQVNESANVLEEGVIWVICENGCVQGDDVFFRFVVGTGELGGFTSANVAGETDQVLLATWETTATAGNLAQIKLK